MMAKELDLSEFGGTPNLDLTEFSNPPPKAAGAFRRAADTGLALAKGVVGVPEAAVGVADLVTKGRAGKLVEKAGVRFKDAKDVLTGFQSEEQHAADAEVSKVKGFVPTLGAMVRNPSTIVNAVAESAPSMILGGAAARGIRRLAPEVGGIAAGAAGEGVVAGGQNAEQVRQEDPTGTLTGKQAAILGASGLATGGISLASGNLANRMGLGDVQTMLATGKIGPVGAEAAEKAASKGIFRKVGEGALVEGVGQELPQSAQEQAAQNLAQGKPIGEGVGAAAAQGMLVGGLTGAAGAGLSSLAPSDQVTTDSPPAPGATAPAATPPAAPGIPPIDPSMVQPGMALAPGVSYDPNAASMIDVPPNKASNELPTLPAIPGAETGNPATAAAPLPTIDPNFGPISKAASLLADADGVISAPLPVLDEKALEKPTSEKGKTSQGAAKGQPAPTGQAVDALSTSAASPAAPAAGQSGSGAEGDVKSAVQTPVAQPSTQQSAGSSAVPVSSVQPSVPSQPPAKAPIVPREASTTKEKASAPETAQAIQGQTQRRQEPAAKGPASVDAGSTTAKPAAAAAVENPAQGTQSAGSSKSLTVPQKLSVTFGGKTYPVESIEDAQRKWIKFQETADGGSPVGVSKVGNGVQITDQDGKFVARISFNGRVWDGEGDDAKVLAEAPQLGAKQEPAVIDTAAHDAATSPRNDRPEPTDAQKKAGNYPKGHVRLAGMDLSIENPAESVRSGTDKGGKTWTNTLQHHYGYIKGTIGNDKDHVDTFVKPDTPLDYAGTVFVVDQVNPDTGKFDEHKVMIGFDNPVQARAAYQANYAKGWKGLKAITAMPMDEFKAWVYDGPKNKELAAERAAPAPAKYDSMAADKALDAVHFLVNNAIDQRTKGYIPIDQLKFNAAVAQAKAAGVKITTHPPGSSGTVVWTFEKPDGSTYSAYQEKSGRGTWIAHPAKGAKTEAPPPAPTPQVKTDKAEIRPYRKPDGSIGYEAVPIMDKAPSQDMINEAISLDVRNPGTMTETALASEIALAKQRQKEEHARIRAEIEGKAKKPPTPQLPGPFEGTPGVSYGLPTFASNGARGGPNVIVNKLGPDGLTDAERAAGKAPYTDAPAPVAAPAPVMAPASPGYSKREKDLIDKSHSREEPGDVMLGNGNFVSFDRAKSAAREAIDAGVLRNEPFQYNNILNIAARDWDRMVKAMENYAALPAPETAKVPKAAPAPAPATKPDPLTDQAKAAKAKMLAAAGKLAHLLSKNTRANITPEQEQAMLPIVIELFEGAMDLGYVKFKQAARYVREFIAGAIDQDAADSIPIDTLQGAYIATARRHKDKPITSKADVIAVESVDELTDDLDVQDAVPIPNATNYDASNLDEPAGRDGWAEVGYIEGINRVAYRVDAREIRQSNKGVSKAIRQIRIYDDNRASYMAVWEWDSAKLEDEVFEGLRINQAVFHYSLTSETEEAFGADASDGDALWARYGKQIVGDIEQERTFDRAALPAPPADSGGLETTREKADTATNGGPNGNENTQPGVASGDPRPVPDAQGGRGALAQQGAAPVNPGDVEAREPTNVGEPAAGDAGRAPGVRPASEDVGSPGGTDAVGPAGDGRKGAGGKGKPATRARSRSGSRANPAVVDPDTVSPANTGPGDFVIDDPLKIVGGGQVARFDKNKAAIEMRNMLVEAGRAPTREEQAVLAGYTGWGSFGQELFQGSWAKPAPKPAWEARDQWLRENLGQKEWEGLQTSIINAHFTDPPTVLAMWDMVRKMGFTGGRTLEPSIGIGNFYGMMPVDMVGRSQRAGIELDPVTGSMAQMLYPNANIQIKGYEESKTPDNFYDLVIGNWPFFEHGPADRRYNRLSPTLHDYFFLKALDQTRPGGLVVGITSKGTMDKKGISARMEMARKAELVAAFRLPSGAFEEYAGTKVVTDIIILRKRKAPLGIVAGEGWIETKDHPTREGTPVAINEYFHKNPSHVIGEIDYGHGTTTFRPGLIVHRPDNMMEQLRRIAELVPEGAFHADQTAKHISYVANHTKDRTNSLVDTPQGLFVVHGEHMAPAGEILKYELKDPKATQKRVNELKALVKMRQLYGALIDAERSAKGADTQRTALRQAYEAFTKANGPMSKSFGLQYLRKLDDPFYPSLAALEIGIPDANGKVSYRPAKILSESTMRGARAIESPSVTDAFVLARNESVNPPITRIAEISGKPEVEVRKVLVESGAGYEMPNGDFAPADVYLSGNVRAKLREAKAAVEAGNKAVERNVEALQKVVPADIPYYKIETQMGATWVPPSAYADFVGHMLGIREGIEVGFQAGAWKIDFPSAYNHRAEARSGFGSAHVKFKRLVRAAIANQTITVKGKDEDGREFVMDEETKEVNAKIADMRLKFGEWLWSDPVRRTALEAEYNEVRNAYADPKFDGSFLGFQGMALTLGRGPFNLREHQVNAIWRGLVTRKSLNAHEVGTGKTFTMGGIAVESRRYGIAKKPMLFAHNANSKSVAHEIQMMYPAAKVLYVDNLSKENLKTRMMQIANDDWDVIVMPHSIIDRIGFKEETLMAMAQEELNDLQTSAEEAAAEDNVTITDEMWEDEEELNKLRSVTAKQLVKQRLKILSTIHKLAQQASKEDSVAFEDMGVDMLLVDEAHEFKKPPIATRMKLKGLQTQTSNRSIALMFLTKYVRANNNGANVHLFTGTPITNTMTEVFHMMRYMMQEEMKDVALADWDGWFGSFAREVNDVELTSTGEYEAVTRLQSFINVPELRRMIGQYMDVVFSDDMPEMVPRSVNGKLFSDPTLTEAERAQLLNGRTEGAADRPYKKVVNESSDMSPDQLREFARVQRYANTWKNMSKKDRKTTMTMGAPESPIIHEGIANKASFDVRLVEAIANAGKEGSAEMDPHPDSKAARTIKNLLEIYRGHPQANQVVFMSQGMAKFVTRREGPVGMKRDVTYPAFSTMHDMIERLVAAGVPRDQIAAVDGATSKDRRKEIADAMNTGQIRIVFGSTGSLGVGVNMQRNLRAMHHMDAPWMPGDLEQRNGRGHRQGNQWNTVLEFRYITDRLDGKRWQTLARKQKFITDFMKSKGDVRVIEGDVASEEEGDILSTFAEAAGDPRILLREKLKKTLEGLQSRERMHGIAQSDAAGTIKAEQRDIESMGQALTAAGPVVQSLSELIEQQRGDGFTMTVKGKQYTKRADAVEALDKVASEMRTGDEVAVIGAYGPLQLYAQWYRFADAPFMGVSIPGSKLDVNANGMSLASLESGLRHRRDNEIPQLEAQIVRAKERMEHARKVLSEPFHMAEKLAKTRRQLEDMERDIEANPVAPPYWLRNGAPIDTEVYRDGKPFTVTGHRWSDRGWFVVGSDERGEVNIPYMQAKDAQGMPLYEEHEFSAPTLTNQPGWYLVTSDKGVTEPAPRKLTAENIKDLLNHNYKIVRAAPPADAPTEAAPEIVEAATPAKAEPMADQYRRLEVGARHLGQMGFNSPDTRFARSNRTGGVHMDDAEAIIAQAREALPTAPPIIPLESLAQAPADLRKFIKAAGAEADFEAAYHMGKIYVLPSNVGSTTRLQFLLTNHEIIHHGLRTMLGPRMNQVMFQIHATNANVRAAAAEQVRKGYATSKVLATEEALADMPVEDLVKLNGWDKIVAAVREWLRGAAMRLRRVGLANVADAIDAKEWTDKDVAYLIAQAKGISRGGSAKYATEGTVFGQDGDMPAFYSALTREINANTARAQPALGWASTMHGLVKAGKIKREELEWSGVLDWLKLQEGKVTREQLVEFLEANGVRVEETVLGGGNKPPGYDADLELLSDNGLTLERNPEDPSMVAFMDENGDLLSADELAEEPGLAKELVLAAYRVQEAADADKVPTRYANYQLPGGSNYREVLLTLPAKTSADPARAEYEAWAQRNGLQPNATFAEERYKRETGKDAPPPRSMTAMQADAAQNFKSSHWDQKNVLAHIRVNDRTDADGKKVLFVEEIQSDWGQAGKKQGFDAITPKFVPQVAPGERRALIVAMTEAFRDKLVAAGVDSATATTVAEKTGHDVLSRTTGMVAEYQDLLAREDSDRQAERASKIVGIPSAPFVTKTDAWLSLAIKRIVKMAADGGYDRVAFVNGEQSAERYDLSKQVRSIVWTGRGNDTEKRVTITPNDGNDIEFMVQPDGAVGAMGRGSIGNEFDGKRLDDIVGKDVAERIMGDPYGDMRGNGLKVGGEGMKAFYDKIVPNTLKDVLKKVGGGAMETVRIKDGIEQVTGNDPMWSPDGSAQPGFTVTPAMREKAGGGLPMFAQAAYTPANGQQQSTADFGPDAASNVETLNRSIARFLGASGTAARPYQARRLRDHAALQGLASAFGGTVQGFRVDPTLLGKQRESYGFFNGVYTAGKIFINEDSQRPHLAILGHELAHQLAKTDPIRYQQLVAAIRPYIDPAKYPAFARTAVGRENANNPDKLREEFVGEVLSDGFMNRDFWRAVGKSNPSLLQRVVRLVGQLLNTALAKMGYTNRTEQYLTDFNKVMQVAGEVMGEYGLKPPAVATGGLSFNRGTNAPVVTNNDVAGNSQGGRSAGDNTPSVAKLQSQLAAVEAKFEPLRGNPGAYEGQQWSAIAAEAASIRRQLFALTGDAYGKPKVKTARPSDDALNAQYASPDDVPPVVRRWVQQHANTLTSDATDAVRWGRIADTLKDDRYPAGDLTIYRAVANGDEIRPGDWVTTERKYAEQHLSRYLNGKGLVLEESVDGRDVLTSPTGNSEEAIFAPRNLSGPVSNESIAPDSGGAMSFNTMDGAQTLRSVTDRLMEATSPIGTVSLWDKTVGTQYNKSTKDADFKRVFDGFYQQTDDTAHYAIEAERHAPDVLMRLEGLGDIWKGLMQSGAKQKADLAAVSKALFANIEGEEGIKQVEYDDRNLRDLFNLNPRQIEMYRQVRKAVNTSIERLAQTYAAQFGQQQGMDIDRLKNMSLEDTVASVKGKIRDDLNEAVAKAKLRASVAMEDRGKLTPEQTRAAENALAAQVLALNKAADALTKRLDLMQEHASFLQENAYMPALRFGEYAVTVTQEDGDGKAETLHFEMFESQTAANLAAMRLRKEYPDAQVSKSVLNKDQYEMFKGVSPETVALFAKFTGVDKNEAVQNYIALAKSSRSVLMRQLKRKGVAGFSQDATRVLASFVTSNARQSAINMNQGAISDALASKSLARKGDVQREAQKLAQYMNNPLEEARRLRGFMFAHFMGGSVASALVNMTQPVMQTAPYLSQFAGAKTPGIMLSSARMAASGKIADTELRDAAKRAAEDGITEPHEIHQLMADAGSSGLGNNLRWRAAIKAWGSFFSLAEAYNRRVTFLAAYQVAKLQNKSDPYEFARIAVIETQGLYGKVNRPNWARGAVGATLFTFKQFSIAYIEFIRRLPPKQKLLALGILVLAAGLQGLPFAEDVEDLIDTIGQSLGYNTNSKKALRKFLVDNLGSDLGAIVDSGIFTQTNVDVQGRLGMGNLIPGTAIFKPSETNKARTMSEVVGPLGGILMSAQNALGALQRGDYTGAAKEMTPVAGKNFLKGLDMATSGIYKDTRGYKVADVTAAESFMKMLGLQPATIAEKTRRISEQWQDKSMVTMMEAMIADSWAQGVAEKDPDMVAKARKTLVEWNERNPDSRIQIGFAQIRRRVQQINQTREQRFVKTVPKELRAGVARELAQ